MILEATRRTILVGEDDAGVRDYLKMMLDCRGYHVHSAADGEEVMEALHKGFPVAAILLDIMMPNKDGFETLQEIRQMNASVPVIMLSGMSSPCNVVQAIRAGATDFLAKPVDHEDLVRAIQRAVGSTRSESADASPGDGMFCGDNATMRELKACLPKIARSDVPVLIQGETGTGKEVLARQLHALSTRANGPFVKVNCASVPSDLMESELFGYERGAFTGAFQKKLGIFELANGGTILLDEIGDMDIRLQAKLLQVLQDHEFRRLGGKDNIRIQVRVIAATHRDLQEAISDNTFREDLYYRLNVFTLKIPSLRERREDVAGLAEFLIRRYNPPDSVPVPLTARLRDALMTFDWPGNVRQLENVVRKLMVLRDPEVIATELEMLASGQNKYQFAPRSDEEPAPNMPPQKASSASTSVLEEVSRAKEQAEADAILAALHQTRWNRKQAAARLKIEYKALLYKMKKLSIEERAGRLPRPA
ncbi:MAG: sigma-54 dependent transcriptional regulator [Acidobacteriia bacterium]|nr:sigma-54 dependent transcriptional regulator [Terriglobia bacterium]